MRLNFTGLDWPQNSRKNKRDVEGKKECGNTVGVVVDSCLNGKNVQKMCKMDEMLPPQFFLQNIINQPRNTDGQEDGHTAVRAKVVQVKLKRGPSKDRTGQKDVQVKLKR